MKLHVIVTVYNRHEPLAILIRLFQQQSNSNWLMTVAHDGPAPQTVKDVIAERNDPRITFYEHPRNLGSWGFPLRRLMLQNIQGDPNDFVVISNDDNIYVPRFVEFVLAEVKPEIGIIYWDIVHSHQNYNILVSEMKVNFMDMGGCAVRLDIAKEVGIKHDVFYADGLYAEECDMRCAEKQLIHFKIPKPLFTHC